MINLRKSTIVKDAMFMPCKMEITFMGDSETFVVGGFFEGDCLDNFADYCYENGLLGAFVWSENAMELDDVVIVGNLGHVMDLNQFSINFRGVN